MTDMKNGNDVAEIDLAKLLRYYLKNWRAILASGILLAAVAFVVTYFLITPMYRADVTVYVNNARSAQQIDVISGSNLSASQQLVSTYVNIIESNTVLEEVISVGKLNCEPDDIRKIMTAKQVDDTEMFVVSITHPDPEVAAHIANTIGSVAPNRISHFVDGSSTKIIDNAQVPEEPCSPNTKKNILLGAMLGILLAGIVLTLRYLFDMRIETEDDIEQYFGAPVLGSIPNFDQPGNGKSGYGYGYGYAEKKGEQA